MKRKKNLPIFAYIREDDMLVDVTERPILLKISFPNVAADLEKMFEFPAYFRASVLSVGKTKINYCNDFRNVCFGMQNFHGEYRFTIFRNTENETEREELYFMPFDKIDESTMKTEIDSTLKYIEFDLKDGAKCSISLFTM